MAGIAGNSTQSFAAMMNDVAPPLGAMLSSGLAFGPMAAVLEARKAGSLGDVNSDVFPVLFVNCIAWAIYGKMTSERLNSLSNFLLPGMRVSFPTNGHHSTPIQMGTVPFPT